MSPVWKVAAFIALSVAVGLAIAFLVVLVRPDLVSTAQPPAGRAVASYADAVSVSAPAVATIYTDRTFTPSNAPPGVALHGRAPGSGVVIDRRGYIVTNWHVIRDAAEIRVQLADGRVATPRIVGSDPDTELALLRIDLPDLPSIALGRSDGLQVGEVVLAIGNSLGLGQTVTMGIVSATGRGQLGITNFEDFIQTDAAINVGNSGGALVDSRGELVGINTAIFSETGGYQGIGFAVPSNLARHVMDELIRYGEVQRGTITGITLQPLTTRLADQLGAPNTHGMVVVSMQQRSDAYAAGLRPGDVIVS